MELEFEEIDLQSPELSAEVSPADHQRLLEIFDESNRRLNHFLQHKVLSYQKEEMAITIFPIASFIVARVGRQIVGYAAYFGNYLIGIFVSDSFSHSGMELRLLEKVKQDLDEELETILFMKNSMMLELYLEEGFNISACRSCWRRNEITVTLTHG